MNPSNTVPESYTCRHHCKATIVSASDGWVLVAVGCGRWNEQQKLATMNVEVLECQQSGNEKRGQLKGSDNNNNNNNNSST
jgi:hypothetical protein